MIDRGELREAIIGGLGVAVLVGLALYFKGNVESYVGETFTKLMVGILIGLFLLSVANATIEWMNIRAEKRLEREQEAADKREQAEWERDRQGDRP